MGLSKEQRFILFVLGTCRAELDSRVRDKPLDFALSKSAFISLVRNASIVKKKDRALYKNLEGLEKSKLVSYSGRDLRLSSKGLRVFSQLEKEILPCVRALELVKLADISRAKLILRA